MIQIKGAKAKLYLPGIESESLLAMQKGIASPKNSELVASLFLFQVELM